MVACALACSWLAVKLQRAREQKQAVEAIVESGRLLGPGTMTSSVRAGPSMKSATSRTSMAPSGVGLDFLADVRRVALDGEKVTDAGLEHLERLTKLQTLYLTHSEVTDARTGAYQRVDQTPNALPGRHQCHRCPGWGTLRG